jgi:hypothetical protein
MICYRGGFVKGYSGIFLVGTDIVRQPLKLHNHLICVIVFTIAVVIRPLGVQKAERRFSANPDDLNSVMRA